MCDVDLLTENENFEMARNSYTEQIDKMKSDYLTLKEKIILTDSLIKKLQHERALNQRLKTVNTNLASELLIHNTDCRELSSQLNELLLKCRPLEEENKKLKEDNERLEDSLAAYKVIEKQMIELDAQNKEKISRLESENAALQKKMKSLDKNRGSISTLKSKGRDIDEEDLSDSDCSLVEVPNGDLVNLVYGSKNDVFKSSRSLTNGFHNGGSNVNIHQEEICVSPNSKQNVRLQEVEKDKGILKSKSPRASKLKSPKASKSKKCSAKARNSQKTKSKSCKNDKLFEDQDLVEAAKSLELALCNSESDSDVPENNSELSNTPIKQSIEKGSESSDRKTPSKSKKITQDKCNPISPYVKSKSVKNKIKRNGRKSKVFNVCSSSEEDDDDDEDDNEREYNLNAKSPVRNAVQVLPQISIRKMADGSATSFDRSKSTNQNEGAGDYNSEKKSEVKIITNGLNLSSDEEDDFEDVVKHDSPIKEGITSKGLEDLNHCLDDINTLFKSNVDASSNSTPFAENETNLTISGPDEIAGAKDNSLSKQIPNEFSVQNNIQSKDDGSSNSGLKLNVAKPEVTISNKTVRHFEIKNLTLSDDDEDENGEEMMEVGVDHHEQNQKIITTTDDLHVLSSPKNSKNEEENLQMHKEHERSKEGTEENVAREAPEVEAGGEIRSSDVLVDGSSWCEDADASKKSQFYLEMLKELEFSDDEESPNPGDDNHPDTLSHNENDNGFTEEDVNPKDANAALPEDTTQPHNDDRKVAEINQRTQNGSISCSENIVETVEIEECSSNALDNNEKNCTVKLKEESPSPGAVREEVMEKLTACEVQMTDQCPDETTGLMVDENSMKDCRDKKSISEDELYDEKVFPGAETVPVEIRPENHESEILISGVRSCEDKARPDADHINVSHSPVVCESKISDHLIDSCRDEAGRDSDLVVADASSNEPHSVLKKLNSRAQNGGEGMIRETTAKQSGNATEGRYDDLRSVESSQSAGVSRVKDLTPEEIMIRLFGSSDDTEAKDDDKENAVPSAMQDKDDSFGDLCISSDSSDDEEEPQNANLGDGGQNVDVISGIISSMDMILEVPKKNLPIEKKRPHSPDYNLCNKRPKIDHKNAYIEVCPIEEVDHSSPDKTPIEHLPRSCDDDDLLTFDRFQELVPNELTSLLDMPIMISPISDKHPVEENELKTQCEDQNLTGSVVVPPAVPLTNGFISLENQTFAGKGVHDMDAPESMKDRDEPKDFPRVCRKRKIEHTIDLVSGEPQTSPTHPMQKAAKNCKGLAVDPANYLGVTGNRNGDAHNSIALANDLPPLHSKQKISMNCGKKPSSPIRSPRSKMNQKITDAIQPNTQGMGLDDDSRSEMLSSHISTKVYMTAIKETPKRPLPETRKGKTKSRFPALPEGLIKLGSKTPAEPTSYARAGPSLSTKSEVSLKSTVHNKNGHAVSGSFRNEPVGAKVEVATPQTIEAVAESFKRELLNAIQVVAKNFSGEPSATIEAVAQNFTRELLSTNEALTQNFKKELSKTDKAVNENFSREASNATKKLAKDGKRELPRTNKTVVENVNREPPKTIKTAAQSCRREAVTATRTLAQNMRSEFPKINKKATEIVTREPPKTVETVAQNFKKETLVQNWKRELPRSAQTCTNSDKKSSGNSKPERRSQEFVRLKEESNAVTTGFGKPKCKMFTKIFMKAVQAHSQPLSSFVGTAKGCNFHNGDFTKSMVQAVMSSKHDAKANWLTRLKSNDSPRNVPWLMPTTSRAVEFIFLCVQSYKEIGFCLVESFLKESMHLIIRSESFKENSMFLLCSAVVAILRIRGDMERARMLLHEAVKSSSRLRVGTVAMTICAVWPQCLVVVGDQGGGCGFSAIQRVLQHYVFASIGQQAEIRAFVKQLGGLEPMAQSADELASRLFDLSSGTLKKDDITEDFAEHISWEMQTAILLMCSKEGWVWTSTVIINQLWSFLGSWANDNNAFSDHFIQITVELLGSCLKQYMEKVDEANFNNIFENLKLLVLESSIPTKIREAALRSVLRLSNPSSPPAEVIQSVAHLRNAFCRSTLELLKVFVF